MEISRDNYNRYQANQNEYFYNHEKKRIFLKNKLLRKYLAITSKTLQDYSSPLSQFVIFKPLSCCFEETIGFDVMASFASRPLSPIIR